MQSDLEVFLYLPKPKTYSIVTILAGRMSLLTLCLCSTIPSIQNVLQYLISAGSTPSTHLCYQLETLVSPFLHQGLNSRCHVSFMEGVIGYAFPQFPLLLQVLGNVQDQKITMRMVYPAWSHHSLFPALLWLSYQHLLRFPVW